MVYVLLAEGFEEIEALTAVDVLRRAKQDVAMAGVDGRRITGSHGITVECDLTVDEVTEQQLEMIVLPGGIPGTPNLEKSSAVRRLIEYAFENGKWVAAICAAPSILGHMGFLEGKTATAYPTVWDALKGARLSEKFVCVDGKLITARGMGVALEFALKLTEVLTDVKKAQGIRESLQCRG